jgi:hypothetical protein
MPPIWCRVSSGSLRKRIVTGLSRRSSRPPRWPPNSTHAANDGTARHWRFSVHVRDDLPLLGHRPRADVVAAERRAFLPLRTDAQRLVPALRTGPWSSWSQALDRYRDGLPLMRPRSASASRSSSWTDARNAGGVPGLWASVRAILRSIRMRSSTACVLRTDATHPICPA